MKQVDLWSKMREYGIRELEIEHSGRERGRVVKLSTEFYFDIEGAKFLIEYLESNDCELPKALKTLKKKYGL